VPLFAVETIFHLATFATTANRAARGELPTAWKDGESSKMDDPFRSKQWHKWHTSVVLG
jgi:hypothetical protein